MPSKLFPGIGTGAI
jgi:hypothetical protein